MQDSHVHASPVISHQVWRHAYGESMIDICQDGTVLIDGKVVRDTLPDARRRSGEVAPHQLVLSTLG